MNISSKTLLYQNAVRCIYKMQLLSFDLYCVKTQEEEDVSSDNIYRSGYETTLRQNVKEDAH